MKKTPMRKCVGCGISKEKRELIRIVSYEDDISVDFTGKANGRGVYVCPDEECIRKAQKNNGFQRSLQRGIDKEKIDMIIEELMQRGKDIEDEEKKEVSKCL